MMRPSGAMTRVCGIELLPFISVAAVSRSAQPRRKPKLKSCANRLTRAADVSGSSVVRPMNSTPRPANALRTFSYSGTSLRHGPHHVAQRLTTTILPLKSARLKVPLSSALSWRLRMPSGRTVNSKGRTAERSANTIGGSDNFSGGGGGGGLMPLLPDCAAAPTANMATRRIRRNVFRISGTLLEYRASVAMILPAIQSLRKSHAPHKIRKARVGTQAVQTWLDLQADQSVIMILVSFFKPFKGQVPLAKSGINQCYAVRRNVVLL